MKSDLIQKAFYFDCKKIASETDFKEAPELQHIFTDAKTEVIIIMRTDNAGHLMNIWGKYRTRQ